MINRSRRTSLLFRRAPQAALTLILALGLAACSSTLPREHWWQFWRPKAAQTTGVFAADRVIVPPPPDSVPAGSTPGTGTGLPPPPVTAGVEPDVLRQPPSGTVADLQMVHFDYDSAELSAASRATLDQNAQWLLQHPGLQILIEGHTDERGSTEYNLSLGEHRAKAVRDYLISKGVAGETLHTMSYGKERPLDPSHSDAAYSRNRRAQFLAY